MLDALLAAAGQPAAGLQLTGNVVACAGATPQSCTGRRALAGLWKAGLVRHVDGKAGARDTSVAAGTASIRASRPLKLTLKPAPPRDVQAPAGTYYLVAVLTSRADPSVRYGFAVQARSVKAAKGRR